MEVAAGLEVRAEKPLTLQIRKSTLPGRNVQKESGQGPIVLRRITSLNTRRRLAKPQREL